MRFCVKFNCPKLPISYQMTFVSLIKKALESSDKNYFNELYKYENKSNKKAKDFTFSVKLNDFEISGEEFLIKNGVELYFSSYDYESSINIYNGILNVTNNKPYTFKDKYSLYKISSFLIKEKKINGTSAIFNTASPMAIKDKNNNIISFEEPNFNDEVNYLADTVLKSVRGYGLSDKLIFENISLRKIVVKEEIREFTEKTGKKYFFINALKGKFKLSGNIEDLNALYKTGLSYRRSQGLGMLDVEGV